LFKPTVLRASAALASLAVATGMLSCKSSANGSTVLSGAGSTFIYPVMTRWVADYTHAHPGVQINYQSIGSGGGIQQVKNQTVDFGASDAPLDDSKLGEMKPLVQIPETAGPVCVTYNLPQLHQPLQLSPAVLAGLFLGTIKTWNDPQIAKDNPGASLPSTAVAVVHRADGSGTTNIFTTYLSAVSPEWKSKAGAGNSVQWPTGVGGKGSEGVTGQLRQSPGAIGYVELTYAQQNKLPVAKIKNAAGQFVAPTAAGTTAAIAAFAQQLAQDPRQPIVNPPSSATDAYPISGLTFLILPKDGPDQAKRAALKSFVQYILADGQTTAGSLNYAPLPDAIKSYDTQQLGTLTAAGQPLP
jgi:phosphate transport system substrate-binding protein